MKAMILAAGRGERMRPLTDATPKPLLSVADRPLIDYPLEKLARAGIGEVVINTARHGQQVRDFVGDGSRWGLRVAFSDEGPEPLETGGGILFALPLLGSVPFWLVNADVYCEYEFALRTLAPGVLAHLVLVPNPAHNPAGDFCLESGRVHTRAEPRYTYSGLAVLHAELVARQPPGRFPLGPILIEAANGGRVTGELYEGRWTDVGTPERLAALDQQLRNAAQTSR